MLTAALLAPLFLFAQEAKTVPVGAVTVTIAASPNGVSLTPSLVAPPLLRYSQLTGSMSGKFASLSSNTFTFPNSDLIESELVNNGPTYLLITSGQAEGIILRVTANTSNSVTVDPEGLNLSTLNIVTGENGDSYQFIEGDTLLSLFGTPAEGVRGGTPTQFSQNQTDRVVMKDSLGIIRTFYFNTDVGQWRRGGSSSNQGTQPVSPYSGAIYYRVDQTSLALVSTGNVPTTELKQVVPTSGVSILSRYFPTDTTLGDLGFQNLPSWRNTSQPGVTVTSADKVIAKDSVGVIRTFYFDGTNWRRGGSGSSQNTTPIPAGSAVYTTRFGSGGPDILELQLPYSLN